MYIRIFKFICFSLCICEMAAKIINRDNVSLLYFHKLTSKMGGLYCLWRHDGSHVDEKTTYQITFPHCYPHPNQIWLALRVIATLNQFYTSHGSHFWRCWWIEGDRELIPNAWKKRNAVVTPLRKAASCEPRIAILGIWGDTWVTRGKYGIDVAVRGSYGALTGSTMTPSAT